MRAPSSNAKLIQLTMPTRLGLPWYYWLDLAGWWWPQLRDRGRLRRYYARRLAHLLWKLSRTLWRR